MTQIEAKVIADSISPEGKRLTTLQVKFHRFILAEKNTHRRISKNSASGRAIPLKKQLDRMLNDPCMPIHWGANRPGMSASEELTGWRKEAAKAVWVAHRYCSYAAMWLHEKIGLHKQVASRLGEAHFWHTAIISSTEWDNFFHQRISPMAQPEIRELAVRIKEAIDSSVPKRLGYGDWHTPYCDTDRALDHGLSMWDRLRVAVARCARVSYLQHDGSFSVEKDINMFENTLWSNGHWSPMEHVAQCGGGTGNFDGWTQLRYYAESGKLAKLKDEWKCM